MTPVPEPKDGNKGRKRPTPPLKYINTIASSNDVSVGFTVIWEDALGERYTFTDNILNYELLLVPGSENAGGNGNDSNNNFEPHS